jgi:hypothetical protein
LAIESLSVGKRTCVVVGGAPSSRTRFEIKLRATVPHHVEVLLDGHRYGSQVWKVARRYKVKKNQKTGKVESKEEIDTVIGVDIPNDNNTHQLALRDPGTRGTPRYETTTVQVDSMSCMGGVSAKVSHIESDPATLERRATVQLQHRGKPKANLIGHVYIDSRQVGTAITLKPGRGVNREVVIPADGREHVISAAYRYRTTNVQRTLWYVAEKVNPPVIDPGTWTPVTTFKAGETVVVTPAVGDTPMATDGSEWLLLEYSRKGSGAWAPLGGDGLLEPEADGTWQFEISTGTGTSFTAGTQWDVRVRRYRDYVASAANVNSFAISTDPHAPKPTTPRTPRITGPTNHTASSGSRVWLSGNATAGARLEFKRRLLTRWGDPGPVPAPCTVSKDGRWRTWVISQKVGVHSYKKVAYSCRARLNGKTTGWSNELTIMWKKRKR